MPGYNKRGMLQAGLAKVTRLHLQGRPCAPPTRAAVKPPARVQAPAAAVDLVLRTVAGARVQALVVSADGAKAEAARSFATFVNSESGREIMKKYGFLLPGEKTASTSP